jgi:hypothetical protein
MFSRIWLVCLLFVATTQSHAKEPHKRVVIKYDDVAFYLEVDKDTTIFLMSTTDNCELGQFSAYLYAPTTGNYIGCWSADKNNVDILWSEGTTNKIPKSEFTIAPHIPLRSA